MSMRISLTIDTETIERIERYAKEHALGRNRAILACLEAGYTRLAEEGETPDTTPRAFENYQEILASVSEMKRTIGDLQAELRLVRHLLEGEGAAESRAVPYQTHRWWEFWRTM